jgi:hypothetical protein
MSYTKRVQRNYQCPRLGALVTLTLSEDHDHADNFEQLIPIGTSISNCNGKKRCGIAQAGRPDDWPRCDAVINLKLFTA